MIGTRKLGNEIYSKTDDEGYTIVFTYNDERLGVLLSDDNSGYPVSGKNKPPSDEYIWRTASEAHSKINEIARILVTSYDGDKIRKGTFRVAKAQRTYSLHDFDVSSELVQEAKNVINTLTEDQLKALKTLGYLH